MLKKRLLLIEDDFDVAEMLQVYFTAQGYETLNALSGKEGIAMARAKSPNLILLDVMLPDMDGFDVCKSLRTTPLTKYIPIIFLTQRDRRADKVAGLELGADDYITKPFDIEELKLRVQGAIRRAEREALTDPRSGLPAGRLIEEQLRQTIRQTGWAYMDIRINYFSQFNDVYGFVAGDDVLRFAAMLMGEVVDELGNATDFIGHAGGDNFIIITSEGAAENIRQRLKARFAEEVQTHYNFMDRQQGYILTSGPGGEPEKTPLMTLSVGIVTPKEQTFADIREITELAAEVRRQDTPPLPTKG